MSHPVKMAVHLTKQLSCYIRVIALLEYLDLKLLERGQEPPLTPLHISVLVPTWQQATHNLTYEYCIALIDMWSSK